MIMILVLALAAQDAFQNAQKLFDAGEYRKAAAAFIEAYEATKDPIALAQAGNSYLRVDEAGEAIGWFKRAIDNGLDESPDLHYNLATAYYSKYRRAEAIREFERVLELTRNKDAMAHYNLGIILDGEGRHDEAIRHYEKTVELTGDTHAQARQHLGVSYFMKGNYADSIRELGLYLKQIPDDAGGHLNLAIALRYGGKLDEAISELNITIEQSHDGLAEAHYQLALIYGQRKEYPPALKHFEIALERGVRNPKTEAEYEALKKESRKK